MLSSRNLVVIRFDFLAHLIFFTISSVCVCFSIILFTWYYSDTYSRLMMLKVAFPWATPISGLLSAIFFMRCESTGLLQIHILKIDPDCKTSVNTATRLFKSHADRRIAWRTLYNFQCTSALLRLSRLSTWPHLLGVPNKLAYSSGYSTGKDVVFLLPSGQPPM